MATIETANRIDPKDLASAAISARMAVDEADQARALQAEVDRKLRARTHIEEALAQLFGWEPSEVTWHEREDPYTSLGMEPEARSGRFRFRRDPGHLWMLRIATHRDGCEHEVAVDVDPGQDRNLTLLLMVGRLLQRAAGEKCSECRSEAPQLMGLAEIGYTPPLRPQTTPSPAALETLTRHLGRTGGARTLREGTGLMSLREAAAHLKVSPASLSRWERGLVSPKGELAARWGELLQFWLELGDVMATPR